MLQPRAPRTPHASSSLVPLLESLILNPPAQGARDPWALGYDLLLPVFQPKDTPEASFVVLYVASAAWAVLWCLALAALVVRVRKIGFRPFTIQAGFIVPRTTTLFLFFALGFFGIAQGYLWKTIMIMQNWHEYPSVIPIQAVTWTLLSLTAYAQTWGIACAANFTGSRTRMLNSSHDSPSAARRLSSSTALAAGRPYIPALPFNLFFGLVLPLPFLIGVILSTVFSWRSCMSSFSHFSTVENLLLAASSHAQEIAAANTTLTVLNTVIPPLEVVISETAVCHAWAKVYYALFGCVAALLLVTEAVGSWALWRQLSRQLELLQRDRSSTARWQQHEETQSGVGRPSITLSIRSARSGPAASPPIVPLSLPFTPPRPATADGVVAPTTDLVPPRFAGARRLQRFPSSTTSISQQASGTPVESKFKKFDLQPVPLAQLRDEEDYDDRPAQPEVSRRWSGTAWVEMKLKEVRRARRNLVLQTVGWTAGAVNYGTMAWMIFSGKGFTSIVTLWSFVAMPVIATPIFLALLVNGLAGDIDQGFIGLVHIPEAREALYSSSRARCDELEEEEDWGIPSPEKRIVPPPVPLGRTITWTGSSEDGHSHLQHHPTSTSPTPRTGTQRTQGTTTRRLPAWDFRGGGQEPPSPTTTTR